MIRHNLIILLLLTIVSPLMGQVRIAPVGIDEYDCLHTEAGKDSLFFPGSHDSFTAFYDKLEHLLTQGEDCVNMLHIGGSHVQAGIFSHRVRTNLAANLPTALGGRGLLFPYSALRTNAPKGYELKTQGTWTGQRCLTPALDAPLGLAGAQATTRDNSAQLILSLSSLLPWTPSSLRVLGDAEANDITPVMVCGEDTIFPAPSDGKPGYCFSIPSGTETCTIAFRGIRQDSLGFRVRGILPEGHTSGITYTASGINGAAVPSWLRCSKFEEELALLPPDLVIFGIGINDANVLPQRFDVGQFKANYRELIRRIRQVSPSCCFIFITNNDCWLNVKGYRHRFNRNTPLVQQAMRQLAEECGGAVFDVFDLMGGLGSSSAWVRAGLQRADHIHFSAAGYELLGDLLYNALVNDFNNNRKE